MTPYFQWTLKLTHRSSNATGICLPPGTQAAIFDVKSAYRQILCVQWNGLINIDHCLPFGLSSASGCYGRLGNVLVAIIRKFGIDQVLKWADDHCFLRYPINPDAACDNLYRYLYNESFIIRIAYFLGIPWSILKISLFSFIFLYLGMLWNLKLKTAKIPIEKVPS